MFLCKYLKQKVKIVSDMKTIIPSTWSEWLKLTCLAGENSTQMLWLLNYLIGDMESVLGPIMSFYCIQFYIFRGGG